MHFKEWLYLSEQLFLEDFKSSRKRFIDQGYAPNVVDDIIELYKSFKNTRQLLDEIPNFGIRVADRKDIDKYVQFADLERIVSHVLAMRPQKKKKPESESANEEIHVDGREIYNDDTLEINVAYEPTACIRYKGEHFDYSWCVSRKLDQGNMYYTYRYGDEQRTFYFVKNKKRLEREFAINPPRFKDQIKDKYHFFVLQVLKGANINDPNNRMNYRVTSSKNDGDMLMSWNEIVDNVEPLLAGKQSLFEYINLNPYEKELYQRFRTLDPSDEEFRSMPYEQKDRYIAFDFRPLSNSLFNLLPNDLKNKYITMRRRPLSIEQFDSLTPDLQKRYLKITPFEIKNEMFFSMNDEIKKYYILKTNKILTDQQYNSMNEEMKESYKQNLKSKIVTTFQENPEQLISSGSYIKEIISNGIKDDSIVLQELSLTKKVLNFLLSMNDENDLIIKKIIAAKSNFTRDNVKEILLKANKAIFIIRQLKSENVNKLETDDIVELIGNAQDKEGIIKGITRSKAVIKEIDIDELCKYRKRQIAGEIGRKSKINCDPFIKSYIKIKKEENSFTKEDVYKTFLYCRNPEEIRSLLDEEDMDNLNRDLVYKLIHDYPNKSKIGQALGIDILNKLTAVDVYKLIQSASNEDLDISDLEGTSVSKIGEEAMAKILGITNIQKMNDKKFMFRYRISPEKMRRLLMAVSS